MIDMNSAFQEAINSIKDKPLDTPLYRRRTRGEKLLLYDRFYSHIKRTIAAFREQSGLKIIDKKILRHFEKGFDVAFLQLKKIIDGKETEDTEAKIRKYLQNLILWDHDYANDPKGSLSPFGPFLNKLVGGRRIGIFHAAEQRLTHLYNGNLENVQMLAREIHEHFLKFVKSNSLKGQLKPAHQYPPIVQFCAGGAAIVLYGETVPAFIVMDKAKTEKFSDFSALSHECGHGLLGSFKKKNKNKLLTAIATEIDRQNLPHGEIWKEWIEEGFADAIGVSIIKEGAIVSLANLFTNDFTNLIYTGIGDKVDKHPTPHIRVLLAIEVGRLLGIDKEILDKIKEKWIAFGEGKNTWLRHDKILDLHNEKVYLMKDFDEGVAPVAKALVDTAYDELNNKKVKDIFSGFKSDHAEEMRTTITEKTWLLDT